MQPTQQNIAPCVKGVEWGLGKRRLRIVAAFWAGIPVEVRQESGIVPRGRRAAIGSPLQTPHTKRREMVGVCYPPSTGGRLLESLFNLDIVRSRSRTHLKYLGTIHLLCSRGFRGHWTGPPVCREAQASQPFVFLMLIFYYFFF